MDWLIGTWEATVTLNGQRATIRLQFYDNERVEMSLIGVSGSKTYKYYPARDKNFLVLNEVGKPEGTSQMIINFNSANRTLEALGGSYYKKVSRN
jgi:hypothetical protein